MMHSTIDNLRTRLRNYLRDSKATQRDVGRVIGVSQQAISSFLNAEEAGINLQHYIALHNWLTRKELNKGARIVNAQIDGHPKRGSLKNIELASYMVCSDPSKTVNRFEA